MTSVGECCIKERILMTRQKYSVLKEMIKDDECGWSKVSVIPGEGCGCGWWGC
jgi:hypothetical protein